MFASLAYPKFDIPVSYRQSQYSPSYIFLRSVVIVSFLCLITLLQQHAEPKRSPAVQLESDTVVFSIPLRMRDRP